MIVAKLIIKRPSISVPFKSEWPEMPPSEYKNYIKTNYRDTGKILSSQEIFSEDLLTLTMINIWSHNDERVKYINDPIIKGYFEHIIAYRKNNGMTMDWVNQEYKDDTLIREWSGSFI